MVADAVVLWSGPNSLEREELAAKSEVTLPVQDVLAMIAVENSDWLKLISRFGQFTRWTGWSCSVCWSRSLGSSGLRVRLGGFVGS